MREPLEFDAEFEALGESEVSLRLDHREFKEPQRAYALRWLNEKAMARTAAATARADSLYEAQVAQTRRARRFAGAAAACALLSLAVAVFSAVISYQALNEVRALHAAANPPIFAESKVGDSDRSIAARPGSTRTP